MKPGFALLLFIGSLAGEGIAFTALAETSEFSDTVLANQIGLTDDDAQEGLPSEPFSTPDERNTLQTEPFDLHTAGACSVPSITVANSKCCSYGIQDQAASKSIVYRQPLHSFGSESAARTFAQGLVAKMPFYEPFNSKDAYLGHGWYYNNGGFHAGYDYIRFSVDSGQDPTFAVKAVAPGRVVTVLWDDWLGNTVVIEHTAPNGSKYRSLYMHLRDGFQHDLAKARAIPAQGTAGDNWDKYRKYAALSNPTQLQWGTDAQAIKVKVGDWVQAQQQIAWSGNTGAGGAGNGLNTDGTPNNSKTANNHLHFMMSVPDPKNPGHFVFVDPYGSYGKQSDGCYDLMADLGYKRLFAPFYSNFHNLSTGIFQKFLGYYPDMGLPLQTLSQNQVNGDSKLAGAFSSEAPKLWYVRYGMDTANFNQWFDTYYKQGYRPRQISVQSGPKFTAIWTKMTGESFYTYINMSDADFKSKWSDLVEKKGYRVDDYAQYSSGGQTLHAAIFVKDQQASNFYLYYGLDFNGFQKMFNDLGKKGFSPISVSAWTFGNGERFSGIWRTLPGSWITHHAMSSDQYQTLAVQALSQGYRLYKINSYSDQNRYNAVWVK